MKDFVGSLDNNLFLIKIDLIYTTRKIIYMLIMDQFYNFRLNKSDVIYV